MKTLTKTPGFPVARRGHCVCWTPRESKQTKKVNQLINRSNLLQVMKHNRKSPFPTNQGRRLNYLPLSLRNRLREVSTVHERNSYINCLSTTWVALSFPSWDFPTKIVFRKMKQYSLTRPATQTRHVREDVTVIQAAEGLDTPRQNICPKSCTWLIAV